MTTCAHTSCTKSFKPRWSRQRFCSRECGYASKRAPRVALVCSNPKCGKTFSRKVSKTKNSKHGFQFCGRKCKEFSQSLKGDCEAIRPDHYGTGMGRNTYRKLIHTIANPRCSDCGESRRYLLMVHHIDGDHDHNDPSNLEIVCANCHVRRHLAINAKGEWVYNPFALTPRDQLSGV